MAPQERMVFVCCSGKHFVGPETDVGLCSPGLYRALARRCAISCVETNPLPATIIPVTSGEKNSETSRPCPASTKWNAGYWLLPLAVGARKTDVSDAPLRNTKWA